HAAGDGDLSVRNGSDDRRERVGRNDRALHHSDDGHPGARVLLSARHARALARAASPPVLHASACVAKSYAVEIPSLRPVTNTVDPSGLSPTPVATSEP